jgi:hypothetical protein
VIERTSVVSSSVHGSSPQFFELSRSFGSSTAAAVNAAYNNQPTAYPAGWTNLGPAA